MIANIRMGRTADYRPVIIKAEDRYRGWYINGATGTGKSVLTLNAWYQDCLLPTAKILLDPSGALAKDAYSLSGGLYSSIDDPIGYNPLLEDYAPEDIADGLCEAVNHIVEETASNRDLTVAMMSIFKDEIIWCIKNGRRRLDSVVDAIMNHSTASKESRQSLHYRLNLFVQDSRLHRMLCEKPSISLRDIIEGRKTLVMDCSRMSEEKMKFVGTLIASAVKSYFRYAKVKKYKPIVFYIDEAQNFINRDFFSILKEARKYHIATVLCTQDFSCVPSALSHTILSNVGTITSFKTGYVESQLIAREFPSLTTQDLLTLPKYHCAYRTLTEEGICKTAPPPFIRKRPIRTVTKDNRNNSGQLRFGWFNVS